MLQHEQSNSINFIQHCENVFSLIEKDPHAFDTTRANLRIKVRNDYNVAVHRFKAIMAAASQELWRCDASKTPRYENKPGTEYVSFSRLM